MKTVTVTEFHSRAKELLDELENDQDILIISRPRKKTGFVVLTMREYNSLKETSHLMSSPANALRIMKGIEQAKDSNAKKRTLIK